MCVCVCVWVVGMGKVGRGHERQARAVAVAAPSAGQWDGKEPRVGWEGRGQAVECVCERACMLRVAAGRLLGGVGHGRLEGSRTALARSCALSCALTMRD